MALVAFTILPPYFLIVVRRLYPDLKVHPAARSRIDFTSPSMPQKSKAKQPTRIVIGIPKSIKVSFIALLRNRIVFVNLGCNVQRNCGCASFHHKAIGGMQVLDCGFVNVVLCPGVS